MKYVLDTNTCIYALKLQGRVVERMREHLPHAMIGPIRQELQVLSME